MSKKSLLILLVFSVFLLPVSVLAQGQDRTNPKVLEREKRISERKSKFETKLTDAQIVKYRASCGGAQTKVGAHHKNAERFSEAHDKKIVAVMDKATTLVKELKASGVDVTKPELALAKANELNNNLATAYKNYINALSDMQQHDCAKDPEGFRASIDDAKNEFRDLNKLRIEVRKTIKKELRDSLSSLINNNSN